MPTYIHPKKIEGHEVTISLASMLNRDGGETYHISLIYRGFVLPSRIHSRDSLYLADYDDKFGVIEGDDGFIYLGINNESNG